MAASAPPKVPSVHTEPPHRGPVLVISPHPDDESIGPGATLALHTRLGDPVTVVFATNGVNGDARRRHDPQEYVARRQAEARAAAEVLGVGHTEFWPFPDGAEASEDDLASLAAHVEDAIRRFEPQVIYVPHGREAHSDHYYCAVTTERARAATGTTAATLAYEVWSPLEADLVVDVSATYARKLEAIGRYESQLEEGDILRYVEGLNRFRACLLPHQGEYGEVFAELPPPDPR